MQTNYRLGFLISILWCWLDFFLHISTPTFVEWAFYPFSKWYVALGLQWQYKQRRQFHPLLPFGSVGPLWSQEDLQRKQQNIARGFKCTKLNHIQSPRTHSYWCWNEPTTTYIAKLDCSRVGLVLVWSVIKIVFIIYHLFWNSMFFLIFIQLLWKKYDIDDCSGRISAKIDLQISSLYL